MTQEQLLRAMSQQLDALIRLQALSMGEGKSMRDHIVLLSRAGLEPKTIADIVGSTANAVSVAIYKSKSSKSRRKAEQ